LTGEPPEGQGPRRRRGEDEEDTSSFERLIDSRPSAETLDADDTSAAPARRAADLGLEASVLLISHPQHQMLGTRFHLPLGSALVLGRSPSADISLPGGSSLSRRHARLGYEGNGVFLEDLASRNGTYVNDHRIREKVALRSGDRFQTGAVHFKFLQERDVENSYHQAIHELVVRDGLTQISNKRDFNETADREFARARRYGRPLTLVLFDMDHFKLINDTYGHLCGDFVLKQVVALTKPMIRREQVFARVGGEEFAILSPETRPEGAKILAERLRARIDTHRFDHAGVSFRATCSFGIAELTPEMKAPQDLFEAADQALYRSKKAGRNAVTIHSAG
jgi:diguanylate cyclase (GGDEF)-like protein